MQIVTANAEPKLLELVRALRGDPSENYALNFSLSRLLDENKSDFQLKIAVNVLNDIFRDKDGIIYLCHDGDIVVLYQGGDRSLLEKAIFQLRYLFVDDPIASHEDGSENEEFCSMWDLAFQWKPFNRLCEHKLDLLNGVAEIDETEEVAIARPASTAYSLDPEGLVDVMAKLGDIDLSNAMRRQPICAISSGKEMRPVFTENYINIAHLGKMLGLNYNLLSDKDLFKYITRHLDVFVLNAISSRPSIYLNKPISLNLNVQTVLSDDFMAFSEEIKSGAKSIILEMHVSDMVSDMHAFHTAQDLAQSLGYRICLDGLTSLSFVHLDRASLGFDLAKLLWNADMEGDLDTPENKALAKAIKSCGSNRMILCRCDSHHAIDYGGALGISLFQGRYPDRMINPDSKLIN